MSGLNFQDLIVRQGAIDSPPKTPFILGFECAGQVEQVGEGVTNFKVGDTVVALPEYKAWAELVSVPAQYVYALPAGMTPLDAVAVTTNYVVAYLLLFEMASLSPGKSLLVHSAGGGVGQAVAQLAKTVSDVTVFGVCSKSKHEALKANNNNIDHLLERGSDYSSEVRKNAREKKGRGVLRLCIASFAGNSERQSFVRRTVLGSPTHLQSQRVAAVARHDVCGAPRHRLRSRGIFISDRLSTTISPDGVDIVLDCLCGEECNRGYSLLKPMGRYVLYGAYTDKKKPF
ncbi:Synaptic vesicle membrane protein VAT-1 homolog-like [Eumeta japonica]|uniref:Synaptic vesicle membrane protein VAT-1 homolog-like n=1 Tax=Eumeta variegata TaxID=151549 RepID=A0A4C1XF96_EUMVA|nr:Synaptic vesicle membrane protein VAT-1 homolog-like [Eumeta japonica]